MADEEQLRVLKQGVEAWNAWRRRSQGYWFGEANLAGADLSRARLVGADLIVANLREANLSETNLSEANLRETNLSEANLSKADLGGTNLHKADLGRANLSGANLSGANLREANLSAANLSGADFSIGANLSGADLSEADLNEADLRWANLGMANLSRAKLRGADFTNAMFFRTIFSDLDLSGCRGLEDCWHRGPSSLDIQTLQRSGPLPPTFLRGVGLPDALIEYLPSLLGQAIQFYSCFISYSSKDEDFARRLHADLQDKGVRCWFAPHDMKIGAKILDTLDEAIRLRDKVLLVLSDASIASDWVEDEVDKAFEEERQRGGVVLFPVRVDNTVFETKEAWAAKLRRSRHIGDFRAWKDHDAYQTALERVLRDLKIEAAPDAAAERA